MSCYVTSDLTVLAIVQGMEKHGFITTAKEDIEDLADALRIINERMVCKRYKQQYKGSDEVNINLSRDFTEAEVWVSCKCWLYQIDNGEHMSLDEITLKAAVEKLAKDILEEGEKAGTWKAEHWFGDYKYYTKDEYGDWVEAYDLAEWDLAA